MIEIGLHEGERVKNKNKKNSVGWHILTIILAQNIIWDQSKLDELQVCRHNKNVPEAMQHDGDRITNKLNEKSVERHILIKGVAQNIICNQLKLCEL